MTIQRPRHATWWVGVALAGLALVAACGSRADFSQRDADEIEQAIGAGGLRVCSTRTAAPVVSEASETRVLEVALDCGGGDRADVVVDAFSSQQDRDAAIRAFEVQVRPRGSGAVWTFGRTTILVSGMADDPVFDRLVGIFDQLGAR